MVAALSDFSMCEGLRSSLQEGLDFEWVCLRNSHGFGIVLIWFCFLLVSHHQRVLFVQTFVDGELGYLLLVVKLVFKVYVQLIFKSISTYKN